MALAAFLALVMTREGFGFVRPTVEETPSASPIVEAPRVPTLEDALGMLAPKLDRRVLGLALEAQAVAVREGLVRDPNILTVIDYSRPSIEPRFYVFDLATKRLLFEELVAHGKGSGGLYSKQFSNTEQSNRTSLGLFVTQNSYVGRHGHSLRLHGLEPGFNDNALDRAIVIHGADYVSPVVVEKLGYLGRSLGCPALPRTTAKQVINRIRGGSAVFAYYPDQDWLAASRFLHVNDPAVEPAAAPRSLPIEVADVSFGPTSL